ncbi:hypothetical protein [Candidatus Nitrotoga sp. 1052]|uniref:hypothetical protein n=1 Tax=Candidatus Nitrotoga sp. 1052 TaxID=2886964 RepID=UPI001EF4E604|nr:hypothetical protein [Candidatus Nitrotoga sp. 1052]CAH1088927.1 hypothetical protein NTG1052_70060 [Candidatus Nitrotoga sp. 1052]
MNISRTEAHEFFDTHVAPTYEEWIKDPTSIRLAMSAAIALNQMADHLWHAYTNVDPSRVFNTVSPSAFRAELGRRHAHFAIVRDVAEAHKHVKLDRSSRVLTGVEQTVVGATGWGEADFGTGPYGGGPSIVVELDDGTKHHFSHPAKEILQLWLSILV